MHYTHEDYHEEGHTPGRSTITDGPNLWRTVKAMKRTIMNDMMTNFIIRSRENRVDAFDHV